ncbi:MAG: glycosyltransferase family 4 protein [Candidatus Helarchaeota archaeon]
MHVNKKKILFIHPHKSTFVLKDLEYLRKKFVVEEIYIRFSKDFFGSIFRTLKMPFYILGKKTIFIWFAGLHAFVPVIISKLFGKKTIIFVGGYDAAKVPEINYGVFCNPLKAFLTTQIYRFCDLILPVDESLGKDILKNTNLDIKNKIITVPTGYDPKKWKPIPNIKRKNKVLMIGIANTETVMKRKGVPIFLEVSKNLPDVEFTLIGTGGKVHKKIKKLAPQNLSVLGFVHNNLLPKIYSEHKVYCQISRYEGLPNALCEAMLCGCVPVGTKVNGIPKAIADTGFFCEYGDLNSTIIAIKKALHAKKEKGMKARKRIKKIFNINKREQQLYSIFSRERVW